MFATNYDLLNAISNKWKILPSDRQRRTWKQSWYDSEKTLSSAALHKIIVENKFQPPTNENWISHGVEPSVIEKLYNCLFLFEKIQSDYCSNSRCQNLSQATFLNEAWLNNLYSSHCLRCTFEKKMIHCAVKQNRQ